MVPRHPLCSYLPTYNHLLSVAFPVHRLAFLHPFHALSRIKYCEKCIPDDPVRHWRLFPIAPGLSFSPGADVLVSRGSAPALFLLFGPTLAHGPPPIRVSLQNLRFPLFLRTHTALSLPELSFPFPFIFPFSFLVSVFWPSSLFEEALPKMSTSPPQQLFTSPFDLLVLPSVSL